MGGGKAVFSPTLDFASLLFDPTKHYEGFAIVSCCQYINNVIGIDLCHYVKLLCSHSIMFKITKGNNVILVKLLLWFMCFSFHQPLSFCEVALESSIKTIDELYTGHPM